jgi:UDP-N-acetylglucosamine diphosphorylase / glucose-1-phosphate thymidylyltransferase / UDP-N-acetylgalactosamine diphosphorylase / glucosamine-1-phosphate N-acetyltransferase / galactosamine-1-phosphate N-acetyltransferase
MDDFAPGSFFDLAGFAHAAVFSAADPVWTAVGPRLDEYFAAWSRWEILSPLPAGVHVLGGPIAIGAGCTIEPGVVMRGPLIVDDGVEIRTGAYIRGRVILGRGAVVGAHSELKTAILLDKAHAPHQNYVGDSILGRETNLGAGTILSNVKNIGREVSFRHGEQLFKTGLRKLGAILGDGCRTGCNTVLNPGVLMGPGCVTYPNVCLRSGYYPAGTLVKLRQVLQQTSVARLGVE